MVSPGNRIEFSTGLDLSGFRAGLRQAERLASRFSARGAAGGAAGAVSTLGTTVSAGAGLGAGLAIAEQLVTRIFELFEGTDVLENFAAAAQDLLIGLSPLIGALLDGLSPIIRALSPVVAELAIALTPLIQLIAAGLGEALKLVSPLLVTAAQGIGWLVQRVVDLIDKIPGVNASLEKFDARTADISEQVNAAALAESKASEETVRLTKAISGLGRTITGAADTAREYIEGDGNLAALFESVAESLPERELTLLEQIARQTSRNVEALSYDMDLLDGNVSDAFQNIRRYVPPVLTELESRALSMAQEISDAEREMQLMLEAFAALPRNLQDAAKAHGLFRDAYQDAADAADIAAKAIEAEQQARLGAATTVAREILKSQQSIDTLTRQYEATIALETLGTSEEITAAQNALNEQREAHAELVAGATTAARQILDDEAFIRETAQGISEALGASTDDVADAQMNLNMVMQESTEQVGSFQEAMQSLLDTLKSGNTDESSTPSARLRFFTSDNEPGLPRPTVSTVPDTPGVGGFIYPTPSLEISLDVDGDTLSRSSRRGRWEGNTPDDGTF